MDFRIAIGATNRDLGHAQCARCTALNRGPVIYGPTDQIDIDAVVASGLPSQFNDAALNRSRLCGMDGLTVHGGAPRCTCGVKFVQ